MYTLRWIGGNEEPDIFRYAYATASQPPHGANRGYYSNPRVDELIAKAAMTPAQSDRAAIYRQIQQILAIELPSINLWYLDTVIVHNRRLENIQLSSSGSFDFLREATSVLSWGLASRIMMEGERRLMAFKLEIGRRL